MRITAYLIVGAIGLGIGWLLFSPHEEKPAPKPQATAEVQAPSETRTIPGALAPWPDQAAYPNAPPQPNNPAERYQYRPLSERERQRMQAEGLYPVPPAGYAPLVDQSPWTTRGYEYRPRYP